MEPEGSLPHSHVPATCLYPEPHRYNPCPIPQSFAISCLLTLSPQAPLWLTSTHRKSRSMPAVCHYSSNLSVRVIAWGRHGWGSIWELLLLLEYSAERVLCGCQPKYTWITIIISEWTKTTDNFAFQKYVRKINVFLTVHHELTIG